MSEKPEVCEFCGGKGYVPTDVYDKDSHQYERGTGVTICVCKANQDDGETGEDR